MYLIYTILSISCLLFGFYFGFRIGKDKEIPELPKEVIHPIETIKINKKEKKEEKEQDEKLRELQQDLEALDNYNAEII